GVPQLQAWRGEGLGGARRALVHGNCGATGAKPSRTLTLRVFRSPNSAPRRPRRRLGRGRRRSSPRSARLTARGRSVRVASRRRRAVRCPRAAVHTGSKSLRTWCFFLVGANVFGSVARSVQRGAIGRWNDPPGRSARMRTAVRSAVSRGCRGWWRPRYAGPVAYTAFTFAAADGHRSQACSSEVTAGDWPNSVSARRGGTESGVAAGTWGWVVVLI